MPAATVRATRLAGATWNGSEPGSDPYAPSTAYIVVAGRIPSTVPTTKTRTPSPVSQLGS